MALAKELNDWPQTILQTLADTILEVSQADSAGISLLRTEEGAERFYWPAIAGVWKPYVGGGTPREFGPCGDVLDSNSPLLLRHIERRYTYFTPVTPPVEECLLVPFYVEDKAVGTIWVVAHDDRRKFDAEDLRILRSLGTFASSAYQTLVSLETLKFQVAERKQIEENYRTLAETLDAEVRVRTQELEQRNLEVLQQSEQLRELSKRLLQTQDQERRRIARDLHDSAGQIVAAIGMNLASLNQRIAGNPEVVKVVAESREMIQQLSKEIRTMSYLLHPPMLTENGLLYAIRWYVRGLAERSGLNIELGIADDFGRLPDDMELTIFRIVQECLTNIHRHSGGKTATIRLSRNTENVFLEIHDDGKGILDETLVAIRTQRSGVGTTGMRERVGHFKGVMDIQSNDTGTTVSATFPVPAIAQRTKAQGAD